MTSLAVLPGTDRPSRVSHRGLVILAVLVACMAPTSARADATPGADCSGGPVSQTVTGGSPLYLVAQAPTPLHFGATFNGLARTGVTSYFAPSFPTPLVSVPTQLRLVLTCSGVDGSVASEYAIIVLPRDGSAASASARGAPETSARTRPPVVLKVVLFSIPAILAAAALLIRRRKSS